MRSLKENDKPYSFMGHLVIAKQMIINVLNRVKSIGTFKKTANGFEVVNPEGYVAIDKTGSAVKLVDRMEFALITLLHKRTGTSNENI